MSDLVVTNNAAAHRYEAHLDGELVGHLDYLLLPGDLRLVATEVQPAFGGRGIGGALVRAALDDAAADGSRRVVPICSFVRVWIGKHPDYAPLLDHPANRATSGA